MSAQSPASGLPPQVVLYQLAAGHYLSHALNLAAKLGIADLLADGPREAQQLADATDTHAPSLRRVLRLLVSAGVPGSARAMVMLFGGDRVQNAWRDLEYCVRTGNPVFRKRGLEDPFKDPERSGEESANFDAAMADMTRIAAISVAAAYDFEGIRTLVDVGGGNGALLIGILKAHSDLRGIVFDQPAAAQRARQQIAEHGLSDRCDAVGGDFFAEVPRGGDAYVLKHVIHDWDDERAVAILRNCHRAMNENGKLLVVEGVYPEQIDRSLDSRGAAANDVNMLVNTGGRQRSEAEFRSLYDAAGFKLTRIVPAQGARLGVIEGVRQ